MATKTDEYRALAAECDRRAEETRNPIARQRWLDNAYSWRILADYVEWTDLKPRVPQSPSASQ